MPTVINKYLCDICQEIHETNEEALTCEAMGLPIGTRVANSESVEFDNEESLAGGARQSYTKQSGKVLTSFPAIKNTPDGRVHDWAYVVLDETGSIEHLVFKAVVDGDKETLMSPFDANYRPGFAEHIKSQSPLAAR